MFPSSRVESSRVDENNISYRELDVNSWWSLGFSSLSRNIVFFSKSCRVETFVYYGIGSHWRTVHHSPFTYNTTFFEVHKIGTRMIGASCGF